MRHVLVASSITNSQEALASSRCSLFVIGALVSTRTNLYIVIQWHLSEDPENCYVVRNLLRSTVYILGTTFPWHVEDMFLGAVNYVHEGYPNVGYVVPPQEADKMDAIMMKYTNTACPDHHSHKDLVISPKVLQSAGIPCTRVILLL